MAYAHPSYALLDVPLVKNASLNVPEPVTMPPDIHPLPDDISAYFVYPFTLETYVTHPQPPALSHAEQRLRIDADRERRLKYLSDRKQAAEESKREAMRRIAPGWSQNASILQPSSSIVEPRHGSTHDPSQVLSQTPVQSPIQSSAPLHAREQDHPRTDLDELKGLTEGLSIQ